jgi:regulator of RNase E activity RraA
VPVSWGESVTVFGCEVRSGDLIHADKHGFMVIPEEDQKHLVEAVAFMDENECLTTIGAARQSVGKSYAEILDDLDRASSEFGKNVQAMKKRFGL